MTNNQPSDEDIVAMVIKNDHEDYGVLIDRYRHRLLRYAVSIVRDQDAAEDVVQQSFIKAYANLKGFDTSKKFSAWIYRIVRNESFNYLKKNKRLINASGQDFFLNLPDNFTDLEKEFDQKLSDKTVRQALDRLPPKYREVLVLYFMQGSSYEEISHILRVPSSTVGTRIKRAKVRLAKNLNYREAL